VPWIFFFHEGKWLFTIVRKMHRSLQACFDAQGNNKGGVESSVLSAISKSFVVAVVRCRLVGLMAVATAFEVSMQKQIMGFALVVLSCSEDRML
jgi:hypothetical protein